MYNSKLPKNWKPSSFNHWLYKNWSVNQENKFIKEYLPYLETVSSLDSTGIISSRLYLNTFIAKKKQGRLPNGWSGPPVYFRTYSKTELSTFNAYKKSGIGLKIETIPIKIMVSDEVFLNKLYCGLLTKDKIK